ncbi:MAG TPA: hypothetical protein VGF16_16645 [Bryobacteraceae bacterium]|jgi:hypothetical protein
MIEIRYRDGLFCPIVLCDGCGAEITDYRKANASGNEWRAGYKSLSIRLQGGMRE